MKKAGRTKKRSLRDTNVPPRTTKIVRILEIVNHKGLHARASAQFVRTVERFNADVRVSRAGETVSGDSIMGLMMLAAAPGTSITVEATGPDAMAVMAAIETLVAQRFGESD
jgi:phosphocarrier protein HPr